MAISLNIEAWNFSEETPTESRSIAAGCKISQWEFLPSSAPAGGPGSEAWMLVLGAFPLKFSPSH
jgi:hypothetical protein